MAVIQVPPKTKAKLSELILERNRLNAMIDGIVDVLRETRDVPPDWQLYNLDVGFAPPPGEIAGTDDPNHE